MKEEFNLSELIEEVDGDLEMIRVSAVKEFIRRLKKDKCVCGAGEICVHMKTIDKLSGSKLVEAESK